MIEFEWDPVKAKTNIKKHRVGFSEAATIFQDPLGITIFGPDHSADEEPIHYHWHIKRRSPFDGRSYRSGRPNSHHQCTYT